MAFATLRHSERAGNYDIVAAQLDGKPWLLSPLFGGDRERQQLTEGGASQSEPAWSPDGTRIAFLEDGYLHTMAADGSDVRSIAPGIPAAHEPPAWSPDGTRLAFRGELDAALYVVGADGLNLRRVAEQTVGWSSVRRSLLAWSPHGRRIAFMRERSPFHAVLYVVDVGGESSETQIVRGVRASTLVDRRQRNLCGPAGTHQGPGSQGLYAVAVEGPAHVRRVTEFFTNDILGSAWSPDGTRLAVLMMPSDYDVFL